MKVAMCNNKMVSIKNCGYCNQGLNNNNIIKTIDMHILLNIIESLVIKYNFEKDLVYIRGDIIKCNTNMQVDHIINVIEDEGYTIFEDNKTYIMGLINRWMESKPINCSHIQYSALSLAVCLIKGYKTKYEILQILESVHNLVVMN